MRERTRQCKDPPVVDERVFEELYARMRENDLPTSTYMLAMHDTGMPACVLDGLSWRSHRKTEYAARKRRQHVLAALRSCPGLGVGRLHEHPLAPPPVAT